MHQKNPKFGIRLALTFLDAVGLLLSLFLAMRLYNGEVPVLENVTLAALLAPIAVVVLNFSGAYEGLAVGALGQWCRKGLISLFVLVSLLVGVAYAFKVSTQFPRLVFGPWLLLAVATFLVNRIALHALIVWRHRQGFGIERVILVGSHRNCAKMAAHFEQHSEFGIKIVSFCLSSPAEGQTEAPPCAPEELAAAVEERNASRVIVCAGLGEEKLIAQVTQQLLHTPIAVQFAPDLSALPIFCMRTSDYAGQPVINLSASPLSESALAIKWIEDKVLATLILIMISPVLLIVAALVKLSSPGPILFVQKRHGLNGKPIHVYKFRTMKTDADPALRDKSRKSTTETGLVAMRNPISVTQGPSSACIALKDTDSDYQPVEFKQATADDDRITAIGRFLRKTSLDELPQFFNVLKGDMSIVGPRPHAIQHNQQYTESVDSLMRRHYVKPGITGLAQIRGARGETRTVGDMRRRIRYDLEYIRNWSLWLDLKIITMSAVVGFINRQP